MPRPIALPRPRRVGRVLVRTFPLTVVSTLLSSAFPASGASQEAGTPNLVGLPAPSTAGDVSVELALFRRRSIRRYDRSALKPEELSQLLWAAQGITHRVPESPPGFTWEWRGGYRTAPSAGALYPLELYAVVGRVDGLEPGLYRYAPVEHALRPESSGDLRGALAAAAHGQTVVSSAPVILVFAAVPTRTAAKYGGRAGRYVHMEVGAAGENVFLQCESLRLATVFVGAFDDREAKQALGLPAEEDVFAIMPVGRRRAD